MPKSASSVLDRTAGSRVADDLDIPHLMGAW